SGHRRPEAAWRADPAADPPHSHEHRHPVRKHLVAFNNPSAVRVYRINKDFTPGEEVKQPGNIEAGIFAHQVRVTPDNKLAVLVTRGNEATPQKPEDPGALKVFEYKGGMLSNEVSIAPNGGKE